MSTLSISFVFWEISSVQDINDRFLSSFEDEIESSRHKSAEKSGVERKKKKSFVKLYENEIERRWIPFKKMERGTFLTGLTRFAPAVTNARLVQK